jgi:hypothetical protein
LKKALVESHPDRIMLEAKTFKMSIQPDDILNKTIPLFLDQPSKATHVGNSLNPNRNLRLKKESWSTRPSTLMDNYNFKVQEQEY